jgi:hypothetical protein
VTSAILPQKSIVTTQTGSNVLTFQGLALTASVTAGWSSLVFTTNGSAANPPAVVETPIANSTMTPTAQTNVDSSLVSDLDANSTNSFSTNAVALKNYVPTNGTFYGTASNVIVTNASQISGNVSKLTNGVYMNPVLSNGQNFGAPFRSPGGGTGSEQLGIGANASTNFAIALGDSSSATAISSTALGYQASATANGAVSIGIAATANDSEAIAIGDSATANSGAVNSIAIGEGAIVNDTGNTAIGAGAGTLGVSATAIGTGATSANANSIAIGAGSTTTATHQIMLGTASETTVVPGVLQLQGGISNLVTVTSGTSVFNGILTVPGAVNSSIANTNNVVSISTNAYVQLSGPSGSFCVASISGGVAGRVVILENTSGQTMVIANQSGFDSTAANRIVTLTGADLNPVNVATLWYDGAASRWKVISAR